MGEGAKPCMEMTVTMALTFEWNYAVFNISTHIILSKTMELWPSDIIWCLLSLLPVTGLDCYNSPLTGLPVSALAQLRFRINPTARTSLRKIKLGHIILPFLPRTFLLQGLALSAPSEWNVLPPDI